MIKKFIAEAVGTFMLVAVGCGAIIANDVTNDSLGLIGICLSFGVIVALMIVFFGKISGCYINPAVTIAEWIRKKIGGKDALLYIIAEILGAIAAGYFLKIISPVHPNLGATIIHVPMWEAFIIEVVISAALFGAILFIRHRTHNLFYIVCFMGFAVFALAMLAGPSTGASMNPARSIGPAVAAGLWSQLWLYIIAPIAGMTAVAIIYLKQFRNHGV